MKNWITLLAGVVLAASMSVGAFAQAAGPQGGVKSGSSTTAPQRQKRAHAPISKKVLEQLNLTADQQAKIKELVKQYVDKSKTAPATTPPSRQEMKAKREAFLKDLNQILTPEQQAKLKTLIKERVKKGKKGGATAAGSTTGGGTTKSGGGGL